MLLLVPSDPLQTRAVDDHFVLEADAAADAGWDVAMLDHDALLQGRIDDALRRTTGSGQAVYRGWMVSAAQYGLMASTLEERGIALRTSAAAYRCAHELPGWYDSFRDHTAKSAWTMSTASSEITEALHQVPSGPAIVKDYVKSLKHEWDTAMFIPDVEDELHARQVIEQFLDRRGPDLVGGVVIRAFEQYEPCEARTWWVDGSCVGVTAHPDAPDVLPDLPSGALTKVEGPVRSLGCPFVTVDLARTQDGEARVVEVGDGQVSDRPASMPASELLATLKGR